MMIKLLTCYQMSVSRSRVSDSQSNSNQFFNANAIRPIQRSSSYSSVQFNHTAPNNIAKGNNTAKIDPKKFVHRQVFNTQLYQTVRPGPKVQEKQMKKYFNISITKKERDLGKLGDEQQLYLKDINKAIHEANFHTRKQLQKPWETCYHHLNILQNQMRFIEEKDPFKVTIQNILTNLQDFLLKLFSQVGKLDKTIKQYNLNITGIKRNKAESLTQLKKEQMTVQSGTKSNFINNASHLSNYATTYGQNFYEKPKQTNESIFNINKTKAKLNHIEFQNKKMTLYCERLQKDLNDVKKKLQEETSQKIKILQEKQNMKKERQGYEYKLKKLKQELEVAHIVKEQNMADKMNYILGWKL